MALPPPSLDPERVARLARRRDTRSFLPGGYRAGLLASVAGSLLVAIGLANLPIFAPGAAVYWRPTPSRERLTLEMLEVERSAREGTAPPVTRIDLPQLAETPTGDGEDDLAAEKTTEPTRPETPLPDLPARMSAFRVLDIAETMPAIEGGLRNYYVHIDYPPEAAEQGIQGRLVLDFIVELDGTTSEVQVIQSLHPLCDSAAVQALRQTRFIPGRQNGEPARVRMRLPVRFRLVDQYGSAVPPPKG